MACDESSIISASSLVASSLKLLAGIWWLANASARAAFMSDREARREFGQFFTKFLAQGAELAKVNKELPPNQRLDSPAVRVEQDNEIFGPYVQRLAEAMRTELGG